MMPPEFKEWLGVLIQISTLGGLVYVWLTSGAKKAVTDLDAHRKADADAKARIESAIAGHDRRIQTMENELKHLPDKDNVVELKLTLSELRGTVAVLSESVGRVVRSVDRIENYMHEDRK